MNKPDWKDAPTWARFLAMDRDGAWYWFEIEPYPASVLFRREKGKFKRAMVETWQTTLEERPQ